MKQYFKIFHKEQTLFLDSGCTYQLSWRSFFQMDPDCDGQRATWSRCTVSFIVYCTGIGSQPTPVLGDRHTAVSSSNSANK